jgi:hypothetical protein
MQTNLLAEESGCVLLAAFFCFDQPTKEQLCQGFLGWLMPGCVLKGSL